MKPQMNEEMRIKQFESIMTFLDDETILGKLIAMGFFTAPASTKYHGNYEGGLFDHCFAVANYLQWMTEQCNLEWELKRSPYLVGMFHDLCKVDQYRIDNSVPYTVGEPMRYEYRNDSLLRGHGDKSIMMLASMMELTEEEVMCIRYHMGAFTEREEWGLYTNAIHKYPNILWTHQADMLAAHILKC